MVLEESLDVVREAQEIAIGATILAAAAALELLLKVLSPDASRRSGLDQLLKDLLARHDASEEEAGRIVEMATRVRQRRNFFAHSLTGSFWDRSSSPTSMFTTESLDDTLFTVARIAIEVKDLIERVPPGSSAFDS